MANAEISTKRIYFDIEEEQTVCSIQMQSNEPNNPYWGDGWKHKKFGKELAIVDILREAYEEMNFLSWDKGRYVPPEYKAGEN